MLKFSNFLTEAAAADNKKGKLTHLRHTEDEVIHNGNEGVINADTALEHGHQHLLGHDTDTHFSTKFDGAPSIVYGTHPKTGKFFVATKSAFNATPKINYTPEDIDKNHGHSPGLADKLKEALQHLPKIMPRSGGVFQGDLMYGKGDVEKKKGNYHFTPNTITYSTPSDSAEGKKIAAAKLGIVTHTEYKGKGDIENMTASPLEDKRRAQFQHDPDVHHIDPTEKANPANYTPADQKEFNQHREAARRTYASMKPDDLEALAGHGTDLEGHVNDMIRKGGDPSVEGYIDHLTAKHQKETEKLKTQAGRDKKIQAHAEDIAHITAHKKQFQKALELHSHLQNAKNVLTRVFAKNNQWTHSIAGEHTNPEGVVGSNSKTGTMTKFVDRKEFSRQNFLKGKMQAAKKAASEGSAPVAANEKEQHHTIWWGRGQPITKGHEAGIRQAMDVARKNKGTHSIIFSHSHDAKNPLTAEQKIKHAKRAFPGATITASSAETPSILHHAAAAHAAGATHLHVIAGADRVSQYHDLLHKYNGISSRHGSYNFKHIKVHSAGERDPDSEGTTGISGTKMRAAAAANDRATFHAGAPDTLSPKQKDEMMKDVQAGQKKFAQTKKVTK